MGNNGVLNNIEAHPISRGQQRWQRGKHQKPWQRCQVGSTNNTPTLAKQVIAEEDDEDLKSLSKKMGKTL